MIEEGLFSHLKADAGLTALLRSTNIFGVIIPQNSGMPSVVYSRIAATRTQTLCGTDGLVKGLFQIDSYAISYLTAKKLANAVRLSLIDFHGAMGDTRVASVSLDTEVDLDDPEPGLYRVSQTYIIWFAE